MTPSPEQPKLTIRIELDLATQVTSIETNVTDPTVLMRLIGQGMHIWANDRLAKQLEAIASNGGKRVSVMLPPRRTE